MKQTAHSHITIHTHAFWRINAWLPRLAGARTVVVWYKGRPVRLCGIIFFMLLPCTFSIPNSPLLCTANHNRCHIPDYCPFTNRNNPLYRVSTVSYTRHHCTTPPPPPLYHASDTHRCIITTTVYRPRDLCQYFQ